MVVYRFFKPCGIIWKRNTLFSLQLRRVFSGIVLSLFQTWGTKITEKGTPLESSLEFSDSLNNENTIDHVLVWAHKIHESVLYQAFFYLFFELAKNEEGPEFNFLDSLNLYKKEGKRSSFTCFLHHGSKSCFLEQSTSFESINSWVLVFWPYPNFRVSYSSSWSLFQLYGESVNVSYIVDLFHWSFLCQKIPKSLLCHAHCSRIKPFSAIL